MPTGRLRKPPLVDPLFLKRFSDMIRERWGLNYPEEKQDELLKAIQHGCMQSGIPSAAEYYSLLTSDTEEGNKACDELTGVLTIGETYFFRYHPQFLDLKDGILAELIERRKRTTRHLRIWSAGCATGEEAYSIAMLLREAIADVDSWQVEVLATDVNHRFLERGRRGVYRPWSFREQEMQTVVERYVSPLGDGSFQVSDAVRRLVNFQLHNLMWDPYPIGVDVILCRNVLIYFSGDAASRIIDRFHDALTPGGYLLLGHSESGAYGARKFLVIQCHYTPVYQKSPIPSSPMPRKPAPSSPTRTQPTGRKIKNIQPAPRVAESLSQPSPVAPGLEEAEELSRLGSYEVALGIVRAFIDKSTSDPRALTLYGKILANQGHLEEARTQLQMALAGDPCNLEANYLLSVIQRELDEPDAALQTLKRILYLDSRMAIAQVDLGNLYAERGNHKAAQRHWQAAREILVNVEEVSPLELSNGVSKGGLMALLEGRLKP